MYLTHILFNFDTCNKNKIIYFFIESKFGFNKKDEAFILFIFQLDRRPHFLIR